MDWCVPSTKHICNFNSIKVTYMMRENTNRILHLLEHSTAWAYQWGTPCSSLSPVWFVTPKDQEQHHCRHQILGKLCHDYQSFKLMISCFYFKLFLLAYIWNVVNDSSRNFIFQKIPALWICSGLILTNLLSLFCYSDRSVSALVKSLTKRGIKLCDWSFAEFLPSLLAYKMDFITLLKYPPSNTWECMYLQRKAA